MKTNFLRLLLWIGLFLTVGMGAFTAVAAPIPQEQPDQTVTDDDVNRVASQLYCPTCEAIPVDVCPTEVCGDWRNEIRAQLEAGRTDRQILQYFADRYGQGVLANPPTDTGFGIVVWVIPAVLLLLGTAAFARYLFGLQTDAPAEQKPSPPPPNTDDEYRRKLEEEL